MAPPKKVSRTGPGALFEQAIERAGITKVEAGRRIAAVMGRAEPIPYNRVLMWSRNEGFTPDNRRFAALALGLSPEAFDAPDVHEARELERERVWRDFLRRPIARQLKPEHTRILRSMRFVDEHPRPTLALYETFAAYLLGLVPADEVHAVAAYNDVLDRHAQEPLRRTQDHRKRSKTGR